MKIDIQDFAPAADAVITETITRPLTDRERKNKTRERFFAFVLREIDHEESVTIKFDKKYYTFKSFFEERGRTISAWNRLRTFDILVKSCGVTTKIHASSTEYIVNNVKIDACSVVRLRKNLYKNRAAKKI